MRLWLLIIVGGLFWSTACFAQDRKPNAKHERFSWGPYDYLEEGFRNAPWVRDPFYPDMNVFKLSGVISREMAFINDKWYRVGDEIEGFTVKEIGPKSATLTRGGALVILKMDEE